MARLVNAKTGVVVDVDDETAAQLGADWKSPDAAPETDADETRGNADDSDESQGSDESADAAPAKRTRASK